jgi:hypothetical protein
MFQQFSSTRSSVCTSNLREYVRFIVGPTMVFFLKSFLENKKDTRKGTQNEEKGIVKKKSPEMYRTLYFLALRLYECEGGVRRILILTDVLWKACF